MNGYLKDMNKERPLVPATFIERLNRFAGRVSLRGMDEIAHIPNSGRLRELFVAGHEVLLLPASGSRRKTRYTLKAVKVGGIWVSVDSHLPNQVIAEAVHCGALPMFSDVRNVRREVAFGRCRFDLCVEENDGRTAYVEVKSVTLVKDGVALFPDAPTQRGRKHLSTLIEAVRKGFRGVVLFCVQRPDAFSFRPNDATDPAFGAALREAAQSGVEVFAWRCSVEEGIPALDRQIEVVL